MSLLEMMVSLSLLVIAVAAVAMFANAALRRSVSFAESGELDDRRASLSTLLRADFDGAGKGLTRTKEPGSGTESATFPPSTNYTALGGTFTRTGGGSAPLTALAERAFGSGVGVLAFSPDNCNQCAVGFGQPSGSSLNSDTLRYYYFLNGNVTILEGTQAIASTYGGQGQSISPHQGGDTYSISIEPGSSSLVVSYYRFRGGVKILLVRSSSPMSAYPAEPFITTYAVGQAVSGFSLTGAPIVEVKSLPTLFAQMPMDGEGRPDGPVEVDPSKQAVTILAGDAATDVTIVEDHPVQTPVGATNPDKGVYVRNPQRGVIAAGDYLLIADFSAQRSALFKVASVASTSGSAGWLLLNLSGVTSGARAWGRLWSMDNDFQYAFPVGSAVIKLAPPVEWMYSRNALMRRTGQDPFANADLGVRNLWIDEKIADGRRTYQIDCTMQAEGVEAVDDPSQAPTTELSLTLTPPALNMTFNNQNP